MVSEDCAVTHVHPRGDDNHTAPLARIHVLKTPKFSSSRLKGKAETKSRSDLAHAAETNGGGFRVRWIHKGPEHLPFCVGNGVD